MEIAYLIPAKNKLHYLDFLDLSQDHYKNINYYLDVSSRIKLFLDTQKNVGKRIYFGQETCSKLIPSVSDVAYIYEYCQKNIISFTYLTPYTGEEGLKQIKKNLFYLNSLGPEIEVVVNDFGVLHLVLEHKNLVPVFGRLLNKMKRMPRLVGYYGFKPEELNFLQTSSIVDVKKYQNYLINLGIKRIEFDIVSQGFNFTKEDIQLPISLYFPWIYITSGRTCNIGSMHQPEKNKYKILGPCQKECQKYYECWLSEKKFVSKNLYVNGNAIYMLAELDSYSLEDLIEKIGFNRIIIQPFLPF